MRLYLINPANPLVAFIKANESRWNQYRVWKPLGLLVVAALTPRDWDITVIDENVGVPDYERMPRPDLVGITAFTSQATGAYKVANVFRRMGVPVVMGGIHATVCQEEALQRVDAIVTGEAESIWSTVLKDAQRGTLKHVYNGTRIGLENVPIARHDLLPTGYRFGSIQVTRGCPLNCTFCSVTAFNGGLYRHRPIECVVQELREIQEKFVLIVDDNFAGTRRDHIAYTKELLQAVIDANLGKRFVTQVTINMADDEELLTLAAKAGLFGVFIGFETSTVEGLVEVHKKFNIQERRDMKASVRRFQRHGIMVGGSFIMGLDEDKSGIGRQTAATAIDYGLDTLNVMFMTPLPGTQLWRKMEKEGRIAARDFPEDWQYYTLTYPVARYKHLTWAELIRENETCSRQFYSYSQIVRRVLTGFLDRRPAWLTLVGNLSNRANALKFRRGISRTLDLSRGETQDRHGGREVENSVVAASPLTATIPSEYA
jgi:radical SAM superfamily enzyme YgiQ (UPF0313 family)